MAKTKPGWTTNKNQLDVVWRSPSDIIMYAKNSKLHPPEQIKQIAQSIVEFGFLDPIAIDENGEILEGHGRYLAAESLQLKSVPTVQILGLTQEQKVAYRIAHNKLTMNSDFDPDLLKLDMDFLSEMDFDLELTGFDSKDLSSYLEMDTTEYQAPERQDNLIENDIIKEPDTDDENTESLLEEVVNNKIESRVKLGEIWQLGRHKIACGDSTIESNVRALLGDRFDDVGMVWADPPYGINVVSKEGSLGVTAKGKYAQVLGDETKEVAYKSFSICQKLFKTTIQIFWGANHFASIVGDSSCWIVWDKQDGKSDTFADCELAWTNIQQPARVFKHIWDGSRRDSERGETRVHPTQKPVALPEWAFEKYGNSDDVIFDPFLGSAPSIIAAQKMEGNRTVYGFELSPDYCEVIIQRFEKFTGIKAKLVGHLP